MGEPATKPTTAPQADLTLTKDPAAIWPDALDCPDYPLQSRGAEFKPAWTRKQAEGRLRSLSSILNGDAPLRAPTEAERGETLERYFKPRNPAIRGLREEQFEARGFPGLLPQNGSNKGDLIAEATHLRGYLRKLSVQAEQAAVDAQQRAEGRARATLDSYATETAAREAEARELAPQAARYAQHLADKAAYHRLRTMPDHMRRVHSGAVDAAQALGEDAPVFPAWVNEVIR